MNARTAEIRDTALLSAAVIFGVLVPPALAIIGVPLAAAGMAGLAYRGKVANAAFAVAIGVAGVAVVSPVDVIYVAPALAAVLFAVVMLPRIDVQWVGAIMAAVLSVADAAHEFVLMRAAHETPATVVNQVVALMSTGSKASAAVQQANHQLASLMLMLMPMAYFLTGLVTTVAIVLAIQWAAKRTGRALKVPPLAQLDLTPHAVWPFIIGLLALAASYGQLPYAATLQAVGLNLLFGAGALYAIQGFGVFAGVLGRAGVGRGGRILAWAAFAVIDAFMPLASLLGLLDFWINFRRLPRDGSAPPSPTTAVSDR